MEKKTKSDERAGLLVRPVAKSVYESLLLDVWPSRPREIDFGIVSERHYLALQHAVREAEVTPEQLDRALGDGAAITALIGPENPHFGVTFRTFWDELREAGEMSGPAQQGKEHTK